MSDAVNSLPDHFLNPLADRKNQAPEGHLKAKTADVRTEPARIVSFDAETLTAHVILLRAGLGDPIRVHVRVHEQGEKPGTGEAHALYPGQLVDVEFLSGSATGLFNQGVITGTRYTHVDQRAPVSTTWLQNPTGRVRVTKDDKGEFGTVEHHDGDGNQNIVELGHKRIQRDKGTVYEVASGPNETRPEAVTRNAAKAFKRAADKLA